MNDINNILESKRRRLDDLKRKKQQRLTELSTLSNTINQPLVVQRNSIDSFIQTLIDNQNQSNNNHHYSNNNNNNNHDIISSEPKKVIVQTTNKYDRSVQVDIQLNEIPYIENMENIENIEDKENKEIIDIIELNDKDNQEELILNTDELLNNAIKLNDENINELNLNNSNIDIDKKPFTKLLELNNLQIENDLRNINNICWSKSSKDTLLSCYSKSNNNLTYNHDGYASIWNLNNPLNPIQNFKHHSSLNLISYIDGSSNLIIGGTCNGDICIYDTRSGDMPVQSTTLSLKSTSSIVSIQTRTSGNTTCIQSINEDGILNEWQLGMLSIPLSTQQILIPSTKGLEPISISCTEFSNYDKQFILGTYFGDIFSGDNNNNGNSNNNNDLISNTRFENHSGMITSIKSNNSKNPNYSDLFITTSIDGNIKLWKKIRGIPTSSSSTIEPRKSIYDFIITDYATCSSWSSKIASRFAIGNSLGTVHIYDININTEDPIMTNHISDSAITTLEHNNDGDLIALSHLKSSVISIYSI